MPRRPRGSLLVLLLESLAWWGALMIIWLAALSSYTAAESVAAACVALACAVAAPVARRAAGDRWRPGLGWLGVLPVLVVSVIADTVTVFARMATCGRGGAPGPHLVRYRSEGVDDSTRRAGATLMVSATPTTVVLDSEQKEGTILVHEYGESRVPLPSVLGLHPADGGDDA